MSAEDKVKQILKQDALKEKHKEEYRKFRVALEQVANDPNGLLVLRHICKISGYFKDPTVIKGGMGSMNGVDIEGTMINIGRRALYLDIRRPMSDAARRQIETKDEGETENV
jgi:hypothetical protein